MAFITITREAGSFGDELAHRLSNKFDLELIDFPAMMQKFIYPEFGDKTNPNLSNSPKAFLEPGPDDITYIDYLEGVLHEYCNHHRVVFLGFGANYLLQDHPAGIHIRVVAEEQQRKERLLTAQRIFGEQQKGRGLNVPQIDQTREIREIIDDLPATEIMRLDVDELMKRIERKHRRFVTTVFNRDESDILDYHLMINTSRTPLDTALAVIHRFMLETDKALELKKQEEVAELAKVELQDIPEFKNESEAEFASILNMYGIEWRYEPAFFPVEWDEEGNVTMAFSPDFYLPKFNLYLELTTMNTKYVTLKKKKLKQLNELYPDVNVKIVFRRDFQSLMERFEL